MSYEEVMEKYRQLSPESKQEVEALIERLKTNKEENEIKQPGSLYGVLKGKIWMSPDFDEPLEDFKDYM